MVAVEKVTQAVFIFLAALPLSQAPDKTAMLRRLGRIELEAIL